jgi:hypothetical protein
MGKMDSHAFLPAKQGSQIGSGAVLVRPVTRS